MTPSHPTLRDNVTQFPGVGPAAPIVTRPLVILHRGERREFADSGALLAYVNDIDTAARAAAQAEQTEANQDEAARVTAFFEGAPHPAPRSWRPGLFPLHRLQGFDPTIPAAQAALRRRRAARRLARAYREIAMLVVAVLAFDAGLVAWLLHIATMAGGS